MSQNVFREIRERVPLLQAAQDYGVRVERSRMAHCPFHGEDRHPSMKLYPDSFYCFACNRRGDVTDLVSGLKDMSLLDAAKELNDRYRLGLIFGTTAAPPPAQAKALAAAEADRKLLLQAFARWREMAIDTYTRYHRRLHEFETRCEPSDSRYVRAVQKIDYIAYCIDCLERLHNASLEEQYKFYYCHKEEVRDLASVFHS